MPRDITARLLVAYAAGVVALFNLLGAINLLHPAAGLLLIPVVVAFPMLRTYAERLTNTHLSTAAAVVLYLVFTVTGNLWIVLAVVTPP